MAEGVREVRVFVSSPEDARFERSRLDRVVERLNGEFQSLARLTTIKWETEFYKADNTFQAQIPEAAQCDIVIAIFRGRLGTELPANFPPMPDGKPYPSGTAYEVLSAIEASKVRGIPDVYVFRFPQPPSVQLDDPNRAETEAQWGRLKAFFENWFKTPEGQFNAAFQPFASTDDFEAQVASLLRKWMEDKVLHSRPVAWPVSIKGSPFRGLAAFGAKHATVFFGRSRDITKATERLKDAAEKGCRFLLVDGPSGSGKSSLARAGLVPRLTAAGVVSSIDHWRVAVMRPGELAADPFAALARQLFVRAEDLPDYDQGRPPALPELAASDFKCPEELAALLDHADDTALSPIVSTLTAIEHTVREKDSYDREVKAALLLVVDQLDELFSAQIEEDVRARFARLLGLFARSGRMWIIATLRADLFDRFLGEPVLKQLKEDGASYDLGAPDAAEMAEIVRGPAAAADLVYETDSATGERLDERLLKDADRPDLLPLLEFTLNQLFDARETADGQARLTFTAYRAVGLEGAVDRAAEDALRALEEAERARLPRLLRELAAPAQDGPVSSVRGSFDIRSVPLTDAAHDETSAKLVRALLDARILLSAGDGSQATVRLAHARVLNSWQRAKAIVAENADFYRIRAEVESQWRRWEGAHKPRDLLVGRGRPLAEAEAIIRRFPEELSPAIRDFISRSAQHARLWQTLTAVAAVIFAAIAGIAWWKWIDADQNARAADDARQRAEQQSAVATSNESRALYALAHIALEQRQFPQSLLLSLAAWPRHPNDTNRPRLGGSLQDMSRIMSTEKIDYREWRHPSWLKGAILTKDGQDVVSWYEGAIVDVREVQTGRQIGSTINSPVDGALLLNGDRELLTWDTEGKLRQWDIATGRQVGPEITLCTACGFETTGAKLTKDESGVLSWSEAEGTITLRDLATGQLIGSILEHKNVRRALFVEDDQVIVSWSHNELKFWNAKSGVQIISESGRFINDLQIHGDQLFILLEDRLLLICTYSDVVNDRVPGSHIQFNDPIAGFVVAEDGRRVLAWSRNTLSLWDVMTGQNIISDMKQEDVVRGALITGDGQRLLSWSHDGSLRLWDLATVQQIGPSMRHDSAIEGAFLMHDDRQILSWSLSYGDPTTTFRIWNAATGYPIGSPKNHEGVDGAIFTKDDRRFLSWSHDTMRIWDSETGRQVGPTIKREGLRGALLPEGGKHIVSWFQNGGIQPHDILTGEPTGPILNDDPSAALVAISKDGRQSLIRSRDGILRLWDLVSIRQIGSDIRGDDNFSNAFITRGGQYILSWSHRGIRSWNVATGEEIGPVITLNTSIDGAYLTNDGRRIIAWTMLAGYNGFLQLWDATTGKQIGSDMEMSGWINGVLLFENSARAVAWGEHGLQLWDTATGEKLGSRMEDDQVHGVLLTKDERRLLSWSSPSEAHGYRPDRDRSELGHMRLWNAETAKSIGPSMNAGDGAQLMHEDQRIISWSDDMALRLWDVATCEQISPSMKHPDTSMKSRIVGIKVTNDERRILSWSSDGTMYLWDVNLPRGNLLQVACGVLKDHDLTALERQYGFSIDPICAPTASIPGADW